MFSHSVQPFLDSLFQGINTTVFAYGMTGSGKTHTMQGTAVEPGVIPQSIEYIFKAKQQLEAERGSKLPALVLKMSYLEIYNEKVSVWTLTKKNPPAQPSHFSLSPFPTSLLF